MLHGSWVTLSLWATLTCALISPTGAEEPVVIFKGDVGDLTLWAYSVPAASDAAAFADLVDRPDLVILIYEDYKARRALGHLRCLPATASESSTIGRLEAETRRR